MVCKSQIKAGAVKAYVRAQLMVFVMCFKLLAAAPHSIIEWLALTTLTKLPWLPPPFWLALLVVVA